LLRNHGLFWISLFIGFFYPVALIETTLIAIFLYKLITYIRNLSTNLGYLYGFISYKRNPVFKEQLDKYLPKYVLYRYQCSYNKSIALWHIIDQTFQDGINRFDMSVI
jgi:hypothetical protein